MRKGAKTEPLLLDQGEDAKEGQAYLRILRAYKRTGSYPKLCWKHPVLLSTPLQKYNGNQMNDSSMGGGMGVKGDA